MNYKKILRSLVLGLGMFLVMGGAAYAVTTVVGTLQFTGGVAGATEKIDFDSGGSMIWDDWMMHIATDDHLYLDAPGTVYVENDMDVTGDLVVDGTITGSTVTSSTTATTFTFGSGYDADVQDMYLRLGSIDPAILSWDGSEHTLKFTDNLEITGTTDLTGLLTVNNSTGIVTTSPVAGITTGGATLYWTGASEWMQIFLENLDTTPNTSAIVVGLTNAASIASGTPNSDQITMELKNDIKSATTFAGDHLTTLRARVKFKGTSTYTSGNVQPIYAHLSSEDDATLTGSDLRVGYFITHLGKDPGYASILELENDQAVDKEVYLDSFIYFHGGRSQYLFEFYETGVTSWSAAGTPTTAAGWLKVKVGGSDRWIQLYSTAP